MFFYTCSSYCLISYAGPIAFPFLPDFAVIRFVSWENFRRLEIIGYWFALFFPVSDYICCLIFALADTYISVAIWTSLSVAICYNWVVIFWNRIDCVSWCWSVCATPDYYVRIVQLSKYIWSSSISAVNISSPVNFVPAIYLMIWFLSVFLWGIAYLWIFLAKQVNDESENMLSEAANYHFYLCVQSVGFWSKKNSEIAPLNHVSFFELYFCSLLLFCKMKRWHSFSSQQVLIHRSLCFTNSIVLWESKIFELAWLM